MACDCTAAYWEAGRALFGHHGGPSPDGDGVFRVRVAFGDWAAAARGGAGAPLPQHAAALACGAAPADNVENAAPSRGVVAASCVSSGADVAEPYRLRARGALCMHVLHVLSSPQCAALLGRVGACVAPGGLLVGTCLGTTKFGGSEWGVTPDGKAPRFLHCADSLHCALIAAGFSLAEVLPDASFDRTADYGIGGEGGGEHERNEIRLARWHFAARK